MSRHAVMAKTQERKARQHAGTPPEIFRMLHEAFEFTVDGMAVGWNAKLERHVTPEMDFFEQTFGGESVFVNPPFGTIKRVLQHVIELIASGKPPSKMVLWLPANPYGGQSWPRKSAKRQSWWQLVHSWASYAITFDERPQHVAPPGIKYSSPCGGIMVVVFTPRKEPRGEDEALPVYLWRLP